MTHNMSKYTSTIPPSEFGKWFCSGQIARKCTQKNHGRDLAEFAPGELYTDQYKVKDIDLVSWSRSW